MSGLETLLQAAKFLEQQEQETLSPLPNALNFEGPLNGQHNNSQSSNSSSSTNGIIINSRNSSARHGATNLVSSSAPTSGGDFQHSNGFGGGVSQLLATGHQQQISNGFEYNNANNVSKSGQAPAALTNGRPAEDEFSSHNSTSPDTNTFSTPKSFPTFYLPRTASEAHAQPQQQQQPQIVHDELAVQRQQQYESQQTLDMPHCPNNTLHASTPTTFTLVDNSNSSAASKQMLLNGGVRVASNAATLGGGSGLTKSTSIAPQQVATTFGTHCVVRQQPHKIGVPLTPPPMPSRKLVETNSRIRSYSMSSHKISANQLMLHNGGSNGGTIMEDTHMSYSSSSNNSPPRHGAGSHYMQISGSGSQLVHQSSLGSSGRRRTISSNSNGAGTREVHNKLEKNRRAHLKECYESLKSVLQLKDEDRKKTSNLAILGEAYKNVVRLQHRKNEQEHQIEQLAKDKITYQKKICTLKRDLGTKYEQIFAGVFPDTELGNLPHDRVTESSDSTYLSSGHGSLMYSSSSSLSSGGSGSNGNSRSSPIGAGQLQAAMATVMSSVISKTTTSTSPNATSTVTTTAPISPNPLPQNNATVDPAVSIAALTKSSPTSSPPALSIVNISTMPLQLTTKNVAAVSSTRSISPTTSTSTMSTSPSSSSASSSPPMNGVLNGHNLTVNIPNGIKYQSSGTATATIIATSAPTVTAGSPNNNAHAYTLAATTTSAPAASVSLAISTTPIKHNGSRQTYGRKTSLSIHDDRKPKNGTKYEYESEAGEPPAKMPKVYSSILASSDHASLTVVPKTKQLTTAPLSLSTLNGTNGVGQVQLSQVVGGGSLVVSPSYIPAPSAAAHLRVAPATSVQKLLANNGAATGEIGRLPGGAELNILPASGVNGTKVNGSAGAFYHANGKLTLMNGGATVGGNNGIVLKEKHVSTAPAVVSTPVQVQTTGNGISPLIVTSNGNGTVQYNSNFAHLLAATSIVSAAAPTTYSTVASHATAPASLVTHERLNGKLRPSIVGETPPIISQQYQKSSTSTRPMVINVTTTAPMSGQPKLNTTTTPTLPHSYLTMKPATTVSSRLKATPTLATITTTTKPKTIPPIKTTATLSSPAFSSTSLMQSHAPVYTASYASVTMTSSARLANAAPTGTSNGNVL